MTGDGCPRGGRLHAAGGPRGVCSVGTGDARGTVPRTCLRWPGGCGARRARRRRRRGDSPALAAGSLRGARSRRCRRARARGRGPTPPRLGPGKLGSPAAAPAACASRASCLNFAGPVPAATRAATRREHLSAAAARPALWPRLPLPSLLLARRLVFYLFISSPSLRPPPAPPPALRPPLRASRTSARPARVAPAAARGAALPGGGGGGPVGARGRGAGTARAGAAGLRAESRGLEAVATSGTLPAPALCGAPPAGCSQGCGRPGAATSRPGFWLLRVQPRGPSAPPAKSLSPRPLRPPTSAPAPPARSLLPPRPVLAPRGRSGARRHRLAADDASVRYLMVV